MLQLWSREIFCIERLLYWKIITFKGRNNCTIIPVVHKWRYSLSGRIGSMIVWRQYVGFGNKNCYNWGGGGQKLFELMWRYLLTTPKIYKSKNKLYYSKKWSDRTLIIQFFNDCVTTIWLKLSELIWHHLLTTPKLYKSINEIHWSKKRLYKTLFIHFLN